MRQHHAPRHCAHQGVTVASGSILPFLRHPWAAWIQGITLVIWLLQPLPELSSSFPADLDNDGVSESYDDDYGPDTDGDGLHDLFEQVVSITDPDDWDSYPDGIADGDEYHGYSGVNYWWDSASNVQGPSTYADIDGDGTPNWDDAYPLDGLNGWGDRDGDSVPDLYDSYPDDPYNDT